MIIARVKSGEVSTDYRDKATPTKRQHRTISLISGGISYLAGCQLAIAQNKQLSPDRDTWSSQHFASPHCAGAIIRESEGIPF